MFEKIEKKIFYTEQNKHYQFTNAISPNRTIFVFALHHFFASQCFSFTLTNLNIYFGMESINKLKQNENFHRSKEKIAHWTNRQYLSLCGFNGSKRQMKKWKWKQHLSKEQNKKSTSAASTGKCNSIIINAKY